MRWDYNGEWMDKVLLLLGHSDGLRNRTGHGERISGIQVILNEIEMMILSVTLHLKLIMLVY